MKDSKIFERALASVAMGGIGVNIRDREKYGRYELSVQDGPTHYATPGETVELALFRDGEWLVSANFPPELQEFGPLWESWGETPPPGTEVAGDVPLATAQRIREVLTALAETEVQHG